MLHLLFINLKGSRFGGGIVITDLLNKATVPGETGIGNNNAIERLFLRPYPFKSDPNCQLLHLHTISILFFTYKKGKPFLPFLNCFI